MADEFSDKLIAFAKRNINSAERCTNEESTKMFLVLPFVNFLGPTLTPSKSNPFDIK